MSGKTFEDFGIDVPPWAHGEYKTTCPNCSHTRSKRHDKCLHVNVERGVWKCWNDGVGCGFNGALEGVVPDWRDTVFGVQRPPKVYQKPKELPGDADLSDAAKDFFTGRGLSLSVVRRRGITADNQGIYFPFYRDGELVNVKTRFRGKNFSMTKGAERVFYGIDDCIGADQIIIVEGEPDALAIETATGFQAILSVPNGSDTVNMEYMESADHIFETAGRIILAVDGDKPGQQLEQELSRRLGRERCFHVVWPEGVKDANDMLMQQGEKALADAIAHAVAYPDAGIVHPLDLQSEFVQLYHVPAVRGDKTGWKSVDSVYSVRLPELTIVTGSPGSGKSEFLDALMVNLARANENKWRFAVFSPENFPPTDHMAKIAMKYVRKPFFDGPTPRMTEQEAVSALRWAESHFTLMTPESDSLDDLLRIAASLTRLRGINGLVLDPWNQIYHKVPTGVSFTDYVGLALKHIKRFMYSHGVHVFLVAHPTKLQKRDDGNYEVASVYDIAGSANFANAADNIISVWRDRIVRENPVQIHVQKIRSKRTGEIGMAELTYDYVTGVYSDLGLAVRAERLENMPAPWDDILPPIRES